ncbi:hypothetical protein BCR33DRAFT_718298 [Rhizoclosmatium globosum]|uniref:Uncharacterized protein n=1 Tax=Rhizoclosmatium globosum TaxID=329046 RepID=A0A1Y2C6E0_9FUNG|nr:hypothetical protein BCR33DRAFT_718298 [Rhizoclosmatium globosum]|eukprot:ORY42610.1 hypothetical protein BCR33DRAFT_718298 [Rhizoclosmatium globosum]
MTEMLSPSLHLLENGPTTANAFGIVATATFMILQPTPPIAADSITLSVPMSDMEVSPGAPITRVADPAAPSQVLVVPQMILPSTLFFPTNTPTPSSIPLLLVPETTLNAEAKEPVLLSPAASQSPTTSRVVSTMTVDTKPLNSSATSNFVKTGTHISDIASIASQMEESESSAISSLQVVQLFVFTVVVLWLLFLIGYGCCQLIQWWWTRQHNRDSDIEGGKLDTQIHVDTNTNPPQEQQQQDASLPSPQSIATCFLSVGHVGSHPSERLNSSGMSLNSLEQHMIPRIICESPRSISSTHALPESRSHLLDACVLAMRNLGVMAELQAQMHCGELSPISTAPPLFAGGEGGIGLSPKLWASQ